MPINPYARVYYSWASIGDGNIPMYRRLGATLTYLTYLANQNAGWASNLESMQVFGEASVVGPLATDDSESSITTATPDGQLTTLTVNRSVAKDLALGEINLDVDQSELLSYVNKGDYLEFQLDAYLPTGFAPEELTVMLQYREDGTTSYTSKVLSNVDAGSGSYTISLADLQAGQHGTYNIRVVITVSTFVTLLGTVLNVTLPQYYTFGSPLPRPSGSFTLAGTDYYGGARWPEALRATTSYASGSKLTVEAIPTIYADPCGGTHIYNATVSVDIRTASGTWRHLGNVVTNGAAIQQTFYRHSVSNTDLPYWRMRPTSYSDPIFNTTARHQCRALTAGYGRSTRPIFICHNSPHSTTMPVDFLYRKMNANEISAFTDSITQRNLCDN